MIKVPDLGQAHKGVAGLNVFYEISTLPFIIGRTNINTN